MNDNDAAYQRPPQGPEPLNLELIFDGNHLAGIGGSPRATIWLHGILQRMRAYESELADYGRTVKRLNGEVEQLRKDLDDKDGLIHKIEIETRYRGR